MIIGLLILGSEGSAEIPAILTDKVRQGSGVIDVLEDITAEELAAYLEGGTLHLGVDLNEDASGNESSTSLGVAIAQMELVITTTEGQFTFDQFYTNTTAMIAAEGGTQAEEYYTLFGSTGSNEISGSTSGFDLSQFDDVVEIGGISLSGEILSAELAVAFVETSGSGANETFFDYSDGFEEFAVLTSPDANLLEAADVGITEAPLEEIAFTKDVESAAAAPEPSWLLLLAFPLLFRFRRRGT